MLSAPLSHRAPDSPHFRRDTTDTILTNEALPTGTDWECARCGGQWNATGLATAARYAAWLSDDDNLPRGHHDQYNDTLARR